MKNERGVTLIAVAITIIILSFITGITIKYGITSKNSVMKEVIDGKKQQDEMIMEQEDRTNSLMNKFEDEWGI